MHGVCGERSFFAAPQRNTLQDAVLRPGKLAEAATKALLKTGRVGQETVNLSTSAFRLVESNLTDCPTHADLAFSRNNQVSFRKAGPSARTECVHFVAIEAILLTKISVNQMPRRGLAVIAWAPLLGAGRGNSLVTCPCAVIRPILLARPSSNQKAPSAASASE
jgi:hypothetical protein